MFGREILGMWGKKKCCGGIKMENIFISQIPITSKKQEQNEGLWYLLGILCQPQIFTY